MNFDEAIKNPATFGVVAVILFFMMRLVEKLLGRDSAGEEAIKLSLATLASAVAALAKTVDDIRSFQVNKESDLIVGLQKSIDANTHAIEMLGARLGMKDAHE